MTLNSQFAPRFLGLETLESEVGKALAAHIRKKLPNGGLIPDANSLKVGDVILSRPLEKGGGKKSNPVCDHQFRAADEEGNLRFSRNASSWSHAMLYVGQLHVAESQAIRSFKNGNMPGTQISSLLDYAVDQELCICRYRPFEVRPDKRQSTARHAILDCTAFRRAYGVMRAVRVKLNNRRIRRTPKLEDGVICSEFILEAFAFGATALYQEQQAYEDDPSAFFLPANFFDHPAFDSLALPMAMLVEGSNSSMKVVSA